MTLRVDWESLTIRPALTADDTCIVEIHNIQERHSLPQTLTRYRQERAAEPVAHRSERFVATDGNRLLGYGSCRWAWWTGQPNIYALEIRVDPPYVRRGIGTRLFDAMRSPLLLRQATRLVAWVRTDAPEGLGFATRLGFSQTGQAIQEYRLDILQANIGAYPTLEARLNREGLRIASLSELAGEKTALLQALQRLWADAGDEPPDPNQLRSSFATWQQEVLHAPGLSPDMHWIALDGKRPVGMTFLKRLNENACENDYTGVASTHRGRGIATALKLRTINWAHQNGVRWFHTSSEIGNTAMVTVNTRLGYLPGGKRLEAAYELS
jgi:GNAT superfamily N-acetyltransferase